MSNDFASTATAIAAIVGAPAVIAILVQGVYSRIKNAPANRLKRDASLDSQLGRSVTRLETANERADREANNRRLLQDALDDANRRLKTAGLDEVIEPEVYTTVQQSTNRIPRKSSKFDEKT